MVSASVEDIGAPSKACSDIGAVASFSRQAPLPFSVALTRAPTALGTAEGVSPGTDDEATLVRCEVRGQLPKSKDGKRRCKILTVVLDRSGSMAGALWRRVVEAFVGVVADELLDDPSVAISVVVYSDDAREVCLPAKSAELREILLSLDNAPKGGTSFKAAFERIEKVVQRELAKRVASGLRPRDIDIATLLFTDGEDTSIKARANRDGLRLVDKEASQAEARRAGDSFRESMRCTGCNTYLCFAAFGADHDPDQCQYLSDRYFYINRSEVLAEVLAGGLGALLTSAGQCTLRLQLPKGLALAEPLPEALPLDAHGRLDHHVWLHAEPGELASTYAVLRVDVEVAGRVALHEDVCAALPKLLEPDSFEGHLFLVDLVALQLRRVAQELCGARPAADELTKLRKRLTDAKERLQPTKDAACAATSHLRGRAALRERLAEVEAARERLSYALGQFDESDTNDRRQIGSVAIDAILRDAGQHVPQGAAAAELARRAAALARLPAPEPLSKFGKEYTTDKYSFCDAWELASHGDALFFQLSGVRLADAGFFAAEDSEDFVAHEAFLLLSSGGTQPVKSGVGPGMFTHLGLPLYVTHGHFLRVLELLPDVLQRLSPSGLYQRGVSERQLLSLLGRSMTAGPSKSEAHLLAFVHKARCVHAVLACTPAPSSVNKDLVHSDAGWQETSLLDVVLMEVHRFLTDPASRSEYPDLHAIIASGLLVDGWGQSTLEKLGQAVITEALRRRVENALGGSSEAQRLYIAWAMLGDPAANDDAWLDRPVLSTDMGDVCLEDCGFNPFCAPNELDELESTSPGKTSPRPAGAAALLSFLCNKKTDTAPPPSGWACLRQQLSTWGTATEALGGSSALWKLLDQHMTDESEEYFKGVQQWLTVSRVPPAEGSQTLRGAFVDAAATVAAVTVSVCLPTARPQDQSLRQFVAEWLRVAVAKRTALVRQYPIVGAAFPCLEEHSAKSVSEIWGSPASPLDPALHRKAMLRVWRRMMGVRITMTTKEALTDKEYRRKGGRFTFPSPMDTFIRGLHQRTADLHRDWSDRLGLDTSGETARDEAVAEMLLRLRWDDSNETARSKLSHIVARIWDGFEGVDLSGKPPITSALWLDDAGEYVGTVAKNGIAGGHGYGVPPAPVAGECHPGVEALINLFRLDARCATLLRALQSHEQDKAAAIDLSLARNPSAYMVSQLTSGAFSDTTREPTVAADNGDVTGSEPQGVTEGEKLPAKGKGYEAKGRGKGTGKGKGKGKNKGFRSVVEGADAARAAMDAGLQGALDGLPAELRRRMDMFAADQPAGRRVKLPLNLKSKQRKAVHLWAEMHGLEHKSFGYRGRRRLHLIAPGFAAGDNTEVEADGDFDWAAWEGEQEEWDEEVQEDEHDGE